MSDQETQEPELGNWRAAEMNTLDEGKFARWVEDLKSRVRGAELDHQFKIELLGWLRDPHKNDDILAGVKSFIVDSHLATDLINAVLFLDGTLKVLAVDDDGRPTRWESVSGSIVGRRTYCP